MQVSNEVLCIAAAMAAHYIETRPIPDQVIGRGDRDDPYMERWMLLRKASGGPVENAYLHRFVRSDAEDRHCHPWASMTLLLRGSYREDTPEGSFLRVPGDMVMRPADAVHAIVEVEPGTLSLFVTGPKVREWGFHTAHGFVPWQDFREYTTIAANDLVMASAFASKARYNRRRTVEREPGSIVFTGTKVERVGLDGKVIAESANVIEGVSKLISVG